jgi:hypothetical protein
MKGQFKILLPQLAGGRNPSKDTAKDRLRRLGDALFYPSELLTIIDQFVSAEEIAELRDNYTPCHIDDSCHVIFVGAMRDLNDHILYTLKDVRWDEHVGSEAAKQIFTPQQGHYTGYLFEKGSILKEGGYKVIFVQPNEGVE